MIAAMQLREMWRDFVRFPWRTTAGVLRERFHEDHLSLTASSLTFTTVIALVPLFTMALAIFTAFPIFDRLQRMLEVWLVQSLIPESIGRQVLGYLTQFAGKASRLGAAGFAALLFISLGLVLTIDRTLNGIWRVKKPRSFGHRVIVYWSVITLGPLLLAASLGATSYVVAASRELVPLPGGLRFLFDVVEFVLLALALMALYRHVPNTYVRPAHAWAGALFASGGIVLAKQALAAWFAFAPTYSVVYGAFATLPILLVWIYIAWIIVLLGAVMAAYMPALVTGVARRGNTAGWPFQLAIETIRRLHAPPDGERALTGTQLAQAMRVDALHLAPVLEALAELDWVVPLKEADEAAEPRYVLLANVEETPLAPLAQRLLVDEAAELERFWQASRLASLRLEDVL